MNATVKALAAAAAVLLVGPAFAQAGGQEDLQSIATAAGLHVRQVQMLLGASTGFPESRTYALAERKLRKAVQEGRVQLQLPAWVSAEQAARLGVSREALARQQHEVATPALAAVTH